MRRAHLHLPVRISDQSILRMLFDPIPHMRRFPPDIQNQKRRRAPKGSIFLPTGVLAALYKRLSTASLSESEIAAQLANGYGETSWGAAVQFI